MAPSGNEFDMPDRIIEEFETMDTHFEKVSRTVGLRPDYWI